jgi:hypothetical protein
MSKKIKHNTSLEISLGYYGLDDNYIYVNIEDGLDSIEIGASTDSEDSTPEEAIIDAISTLKVLITRLEKLRGSRNPMQTLTQSVANNINYFLE